MSRSRFPRPRSLIRQYLDWFGRDNYYLELQHNLVSGDTERNRSCWLWPGKLGVKVVATGNVHYHVRERHQLQDCLVAIRHCKSLEETPPGAAAQLRVLSAAGSRNWKLFSRNVPEALANTLDIAERCTFDLTRDLSYTFPDYPAPDGLYARKLPGKAVPRGRRAALRLCHPGGTEPGWSRSSA